MRMITRIILIWIFKPVRRHLYCNLYLEVGQLKEHLLILTSQTTCILENVSRFIQKIDGYI